MDEVVGDIRRVSGAEREAWQPLGRSRRRWVYNGPVKTVLLLWVCRLASTGSGLNSVAAFCDQSRSLKIP